MRISNYLNSFRTHLTLLFMFGILTVGLTAQVYTDNSNYSLVNANNGGQVKLRNAPNGSGNPGWMRSLCDGAQLPSEVRDSRLTQGDFNRNICQMPAVTQTLISLNNRKATYTESGTIVTQSNLEQHRAAIANNGGKFIFRGDINISQSNHSVNQALNKLIQVGSNTTIWIDGIVRYLGPVLPGTVPDSFSVSDVINGVFEIKGSNTSAVDGVGIYGTKRGKIIGNNRLASVYTRYAKNLKIEGVTTEKCRNVMFLNNVYGNSIVKGNFIYKSKRRAIHLKATIGLTVENNLIYDAEVDGIDIDAYAKQSKVNRNVLIKSGSRLMVWTEIVAVDNIIDGNVGIHYNDNDGGFQENGSENHEAPTARNMWKNNHIFYANSSINWRQGFSFHPSRNIDRNSVNFENNYVWQQTTNGYKRNPKTHLNDVAFYRFNSTKSTTSINESEKPDAMEFSIVPNIVNQGTFTIKLKGYSSDAKISIYSVHGALVSSRLNNTNSTVEFDANLFNPGMYIVNVSDGIFNEPKKIIIK